MATKKVIPPEEMTVGEGEFVCYVYGLYFQKEGHRYSDRIRYVGKAIDPWRRFSTHMNPKDNYGRVQRSVLKNGAECFSLKILVKAFGRSLRESEERAFEWEAHLIKLLGTVNYRHGLNLTYGGEGYTLTGEARARHRKASQRVMREIKQRPEVREKYREMGRERMRDPRLREAFLGSESQEKRRATLKRRYQTEPEFLAQRREILNEARKSPAAIESARKQARFLNTDPDVRKRRAESVRKHNTEEVRAQKAKIARDLHQDPEFAAKYRAGLERRYSDPANVASHAKKSRERWENDPTLRQSVLIGIHLRWARKHLADGKIAAAEGQIEKLREVLASCDVSRKIRLRPEAEAFLAEMDAAELLLEKKPC